MITQIPSTARMNLQVSTTTTAIVDALLSVSIGCEISYGALANAAGAEDVDFIRGNIASARRIAQRERGAVFVPVRGVGLRRLEPDQASQVGEAARHKIRRSSRKAVTAMVRLANTSNGLSPDAQKRLNQEISTLGLISEISNNRVASNMGSGEAVLPPTLAADAFRELVGGRRRPSETTVSA